MNKFHEYFLKDKDDKIGKDFLELYPKVDKSHKQYLLINSQRIAFAYTALANKLCPGEPIIYSFKLNKITNFSNNLTECINDIAEYYPTLKQKVILFCRYVKEKYDIDCSHNQVVKEKDNPKQINEVSIETKKEEPTYKQIAAKGGENSYQDYKPLRNKVKELCKTELSKKTYLLGRQLSHYIAKLIEQKYIDLVKVYLPYQQYKRDNTDWRIGQFYNWCNDVYKIHQNNIQQ